MKTHPTLLDTQCPLRLRRKLPPPAFLLALLGAALALAPAGIVAQIQWTKDPPLDPVLSGGASGTWNAFVFGPNVLFNTDSARFEMWFGASVGFPEEESVDIGFAVSDDGINWTMQDTAVLSPDPGTWDALSVERPAVIRENGQYKMWYTGLSSWPSGRIGYATSSDGKQWTKDTVNNPVLEPGTAAWEAGGAGWCAIIPVQGGYKMWYTGVNAGGTSSQIGYATSADGISWQKDTMNPVLPSGTFPQWDDGHVIGPSVLHIDGPSAYYMWYAGFRSSGERRIGLATSPDGIQWTKYDKLNTSSAPFDESDPVL